jgi:tRNA A37 threonylcarbamoyladenosine synthetase subunit TsaC/SUA5/YrdC
MDSIRDYEACNKAARLLREGFPIGTYIRGVCGLWADGQQQAALDTIYKIKGEKRNGRPIGATLTSAEFAVKLDPDLISPSVRDLVFNVHQLATRLGSICFIRAPIKSVVGASLPDRLISRTDDGTYWIQNWLPEGCYPAATWLESLHKMSIRLPVATSMNVSGNPEIVEPEEGRRFCEANGVPMFLADLGDPGRARGSFPIIHIDIKGITLIREGHFPAHLFRLLLHPWEIDLSNYQPAKYPLMDYSPAEEQTSGQPAELRVRLVETMDGAIPSSDSMAG